MIEVVNIDSNLSSKDVSAIKNLLNHTRGIKLDFLYHTATKIPAYLVSDELMDRIAPSEEYFDINPECLEELIRITFERKPEEDLEDRNILERFNELSRKCRRRVDPGFKFVALGVYIRDYSNNTLNEIKKKYGNFEEKPSIFVAPERSYNSAQNLKADFMEFLKNVFAHEYAHAFMDPKILHPEFKSYYSNELFRTIEESLANAVSHNNFSRTPSWFREFVENQPVYYKGYYFFTKGFEATKFYLSKLERFWHEWGYAFIDWLLSTRNIPVPPILTRGITLNSMLREWRRYKSVFRDKTYHLNLGLDFEALGMEILLEVSGVKI